VRRGSVRVLVGLVISLALIFLAVSFLDLRSIWKEIVSVNKNILLLGFLLAIVHQFSSAWRWKILLGALGNSQFSIAFWSLRLNYFLNACLPARMGEGFRVYFLKRRANLSSARVIGAMGAEKALDLATLIGFLYLSFIVLGRRGNLSMEKIIVILVLSISLAVFLLAKAPKESRRPWLHRVLQFRVRVFEGLQILLRRHILWPGLALSVVGWLIHGVIVTAFLYGLDHPFSFFRSMFVVGAVSFAVAIPASPGNIGTFEAGAVGALTYLYDIELEKAVGVAVLYHLVQIVPTILVGLIGYFKIGLGGFRGNDSAENKLSDAQ